MSLGKRDLEVFVQPGFLTALALLLVNDFYLKIHYPGWFTGKLSDFAGLYVFIQFIAVFSGFQVVRVAIVSVSLFVFWKSTLVTPLIDFVNRYSIVQIGRTIDHTDLIALLIVPIAVKQYTTRVNWVLSFVKYPVAAVAMLAIMATSVIRPSYNVRFDLQALPGHSDIIAAIYEKTDKLLAQYEFICPTRATESTYYECNNTKGDGSVQFHYDGFDRKLYVSLETYDVELEKARIDEIKVELMKLLRSDFENITVVTSGRFKVQHESTIEFEIEAPSAGFPLSCKGNGINHPEISKTIEIFDELTNFPGAINLQRCYDGGERCSRPMCRHIVFGRVIGPGLSERSIHVRTRGYVGWTGTSLFIDVIEYGLKNEALEFTNNLEKHLRASLGEEARITRTELPNRDE